MADYYRENYLESWEIAKNTLKTITIHKILTSDYRPVTL